MKKSDEFIYTNLFFQSNTDKLGASIKKNLSFQMYLVEIAYWNILTSELLVSTHIVCERLSAMQEQVKTSRIFGLFFLSRIFGSFYKEYPILGKALPTYLPPLPLLPSVNRETNKLLQVGHA